MLIQPKDITLEAQDGSQHAYRIGKLPYMAGGREVCTQYISTAVPKVGNYQSNEELAAKLLAHVAVIQDDGTELVLKTRELINNHIPDFTTGIKLEQEALEHNMGFSVLGRLQEFQQGWLENLPGSITRILTRLQDALSARESVRSTTSEPSTAPRTQ